MPFANNANADFLSSIISDILAGRITCGAACDTISGTACDMIDCAGNERNLAPRLLTKAEADGDTESLVSLRLLGIASRFGMGISDGYGLLCLVQDLRSDRIDGGHLQHVIARSSRIAIVAAQRYSRREEPTAAHRLAIGNGDAESETRLVVAIAVAAGNTPLLVLAAKLGVVMQDGDRFTYREHDVTGQTADWRAQVDRIQRRARAVGNPYVFADASRIKRALDLQSIFADLSSGNWIGNDTATKIISDVAKRKVATIVDSDEDEVIRLLLAKASSTPINDKDTKFLSAAHLLGVIEGGNNACQALVNDAQNGRVDERDFCQAISKAARTVERYAWEYEHDAFKKSNEALMKSILGEDKANDTDTNAANTGNRNLGRSSAAETKRLRGLVAALSGALTFMALLNALPDKDIRGHGCFALLAVAIAFFVHRLLVIF